MATLRTITRALRAAADRHEPVVLASVVRVVGSSYGGVGARMVVRVDGDTVGLVSGGCLESDLAAHALRVHGTRVPLTVTYDTRADDDAVWGLGLGCNGLIDVLLEPLQPADARAAADLLDRALDGPDATVLATVTQSSRGSDSRAPTAGAKALFRSDGESPLATTGDWGETSTLASAAAHRGHALAAGRRGFVTDSDGTVIAFEVIHPAVRLVICGSGPDVVPVARFAVQLGWDTTVVDHRPVSHAQPERFDGATVIECADPLRLADHVSLQPNSAAVVMSHHFARDTDYVAALLESGIRYIGVLGPRSRTDRMLAELAARAGVSIATAGRLRGPVGLDLGGDGPEAIALAIIAEVAAVSRGRLGGSLSGRSAGRAEEPVRG